MSAINTTTDTFTCQLEEDLAVITILEGARLISATVRDKEALFETLRKINTSPEVKGLAVMYSDQYMGDESYKKFLLESLDQKSYAGSSHYATTYKSAIVQVLEEIKNFTKPIVGGMDCDIGATPFAVNLAFDLRVATEDTKFFFPNLRFGLPPSPPLSYFFIESLGFSKTKELIMNKSELSAQEAFDLGFITQIVSKEDLTKTCLEKLRKLSTIPGFTLIETRRMLHPDMDKMRNYIDSGFDSAVRCMNKIKT
jgi:enoyl-CoA hydratase/carnithine racemase